MWELLLIYLQKKANLSFRSDPILEDPRVAWNVKGMFNHL